MDLFIKNIKYIVEHSPDFIKKSLMNFFQRWNSKIIWDEQLIREMMKHYNLNYEETKCMMKLGRKLFCNFWNVLNPKNDEETMSFYKMPFPYDVFSLAYWHMSRGQRKFRKRIVKESFGDVLDYGGGIGDLSLKMARKNLNVTYTEINGENMKFASAFFKKMGYNIEVLDVEKEQEKIWAKKYDTIVCIDVIEHIPHPEAVLKKMAEHLRDNGRLIITALDCIGPTDDAPMHFKIDFNVENFLNSFKVFKSNTYNWLWIKQN